MNEREKGIFKVDIHADLTIVILIDYLLCTDIIIKLLDSSGSLL
jgi:hypothetical protein